jgi:hypothetical protein
MPKASLHHNPLRAGSMERPGVYIYQSIASKTFRVDPTDPLHVELARILAIYNPSNLAGDKRIVEFGRDHPKLLRRANYLCDRLGIEANTWEGGWAKATDCHTRYRRNDGAVTFVTTADELRIALEVTRAG